MRQNIFIYLLAALLALSSCDKEIPNPNGPNPTNPGTGNSTPPTPPMPSVTNSDGLMAAISVLFLSEVPDMPMPVEIETELVAATFGTPPADVGAVSVNDIALEKNDQNSYHKMATAGQTPSSFGFSERIQWEVPSRGISVNDGGSFPRFTGDLPKIVSRSGLVIHLDYFIKGAPDSVVVFLASGDKQIVKTVAGNASSVTLSSEELSVLPTTTPTSPGFIQVAPYKIRSLILGGKTYHFVKQRSVVQTMRIGQ